ncbi:MAG: glycosyltransferase family 4 protein [Patescibacteria group bacterium]
MKDFIDMIEFTNMLRGLFSKPHSRLFIVGDNSGWSTDIDAEDLNKIARRLGYSSNIIKRMYFNLPQAVHYTSQFSLLLKDIYKSKHRLSVDYYHGKPEDGENFKKCFEAFKAHHEHFSAIRVSNKEMEGFLKTSGIAPEKVMRIPIGVDLDVFKPVTMEARQAARAQFSIREDAVVIGSFQKDGVGWGEGLEPKLIKGPDIFLKVIENIKQEFPNVFVLLSGPSRGYIKQGLEKLDVPYRHSFYQDYREISKLYDALDLYIITSRVEGGPKACLESMAKGIPLLTTAVGQCRDLVNHGQNAMMAAIEDIDTLSKYALEILKDKEKKNGLIREGFSTARQNSFDAQLPLWQIYLSKLIDGSPDRK